LLYKDELKKFLDEKGVLAWGVVPTSQDVPEGEMDAKKLSKKILSAQKEKNINPEFSIITSSCGSGSLSDIERTKKIHTLTKEVAGELSAK